MEVLYSHTNDKIGAVGGSILTPPYYPDTKEVTGKAQRLVNSLTNKAYKEGVNNAQREKLFKEIFLKDSNCPDELLKNLSFETLQELYEI